MKETMCSLMGLFALGFTVALMCASRHWPKTNEVLSSIRGYHLDCFFKESYEKLIRTQKSLFILTALILVIGLYLLSFIPRGLDGTVFAYPLGLVVGLLLLDAFRKEYLDAYLHRELLKVKLTDETFRQYGEISTAVHKVNCKPGTEDFIPDCFVINNTYSFTAKDFIYHLAVSPVIGKDEPLNPSFIVLSSDWDLENVLSNPNEVHFREYLMQTFGYLPDITTFNVQWQRVSVQLDKINNQYWYQL